MKKEEAFCLLSKGENKQNYIQQCEMVFCGRKQCNIIVINININDKTIMPNVQNLTLNLFDRMTCNNKSVVTTRYKIFGIPHYRFMFQ